MCTFFSNIFISLLKKKPTYEEIQKKRNKILPFSWKLNQ